MNTAKQLHRGYLPPAYRWQLEEVVLGAILLEKTAMPQVYDLLSPNNFVGLAERGHCDYLNQHRTVQHAKETRTVPHAWIYQTMQEMFEAAQQIDIVTVGTRIHQKWSVTASYQIAQLTDRVTSDAAIQDHAMLLVQDSMTHSLLQILNRAYATIAADGLTEIESKQNIAEMIDALQKGYDPIDAATITHRYCNQYGLSTVADQLEQYATLAEAKLQQIRTRQRSNTMVKRLAEVLTANVVNEQALHTLQNVANYLATKQGNANTEFIEKLYQLNREIK